MKQNNSVATSYNSMKSSVNTEMLLQKTHQVYMAVGEVKGSTGAKSIIRYVAAENAANWECVVEYAYSLVCNDKEIKKCLEKVDWKQVCMYNALLKELSKKCETAYAYKELVEMAAVNLGLDVKSMLAEAILDAYGWNKVVTEMVATYEALMRECKVNDILEVEDNVDEQPQTEISEKATLKTPRTKKEKAPATKTVSVVPSIPVARKHASKCKAVMQVFADGTTRVFASITDAGLATKIKHSSISKNLHKYEGYRTVNDRVSGQKCRFEYVNAA